MYFRKNYQHKVEGDYSLMSKATVDTLSIVRIHPFYYTNSTQKCTLQSTNPVTVHFPNYYLLFTGSFSFSLTNLFISVYFFLSSNHLK